MSLEVTRHAPDGARESSPEQPAFYFDLGSPESYLAAERVLGLLPVVAEWRPVLATELPDGLGDLDQAAIERVAAERDMQTLRWPAVVPPDTAAAMRAATYAKRIGRTVAFCLAAFRQAFAAGRDLADPETVLIAGAACEMHPTALLKGMELRSVAGALEHATEEALVAGVRRVPALRAGWAVFHGDAGLDEAARALASERGATED